MQKPSRFTRRILLELKLQTSLLRVIAAEWVQQNSLPPAESKAPAVPRKAFITAAEAAILLVLNKAYARQKVCQMKKDHQLHLRDPLPTAVFMLETGLTYDDIIEGLR